MEENIGKKNELHQDKHKSTWPHEGRPSRKRGFMKGGSIWLGTVLGQGLPASQKNICEGPNSILVRKPPSVARGSRMMGRSEAVMEETKPGACFPERSFDW